MSSTAVLMWGMLFGAIGFGFLLYGQKQKAVVPLCVGIALFALVALAVVLLVLEMAQFGPPL